MATATAQQPVNSTTFALLGVAPVMVQNLGPGPVTIIVAQSLPSVGTAGYELQSGAPMIFQPIQSATLDNVYVAMYGGVAATIAFSVVFPTATI